MGENIDFGRIAFVFEGDWDGNKSYSRLSAVRYSPDGCGYIAVRDNRGVIPGTDLNTWMKIVDKGDKGDKGDKPQISAETNSQGNVYMLVDGKRVTDSKGRPINFKGEHGEPGSTGIGEVTASIDIFAPIPRVIVTTSGPDSRKNIHFHFEGIGRSSDTPVDDSYPRYEYVDLGLPSGTKWATANVGAGSSDQYGLLCSWGELASKQDYTWNTYAFGTENNLTKYNFSDEKKNLDAEDDVAFILMGDKWHMPSKGQCKELIDSTTASAEIVNGVYGIKLTSNINGNSIFMPAAGERTGSGSSGTGEEFKAWSSEVGDISISKAIAYEGDSIEGGSTEELDRYLGMSVRGVLNSPEHTVSTNVVRYFGTSKILYDGSDVTHDYYYAIVDESADVVRRVAMLQPTVDAESGKTIMTTVPGMSFGPVEQHVDVNEGDWVLFRFNSVQPTPIRLVPGEIGSMSFTSGGNNITMVYQEMHSEVGGKTYYALKKKYVNGALVADYYNLYNVFNQNLELLKTERPDSEGSGEMFHFVNGVAYPEVYEPDSSGGDIPTPEPYVDVESVDLGLPSGTLWATKNVNAYKKEQDGNYFAFGEIMPKEEYTWSNYKFGTSDALTKYNSTDGLRELDVVDDVAFAALGDTWHMPSNAQVVELLTETTQIVTTVNNVEGLLFISNANGNSIFIPAAGRYNNSDTKSDYGTGVYTWGSTVGYTLTNGRDLECAALGGLVAAGEHDRAMGFPVRAVKPSSGSGVATTYVRYAGPAKTVYEDGVAVPDWYYAIVDEATNTLKFLNILYEYEDSVTGDKIYVPGDIAIDCATPMPINENDWVMYRYVEATDKFIPFKLTYRSSGTCNKTIDGQLVKKDYDIMYSPSEGVNYYMLRKRYVDGQLVYDCPGRSEMINRDLNKFMNEEPDISGFLVAFKFVNRTVYVK